MQMTKIGHSSFTKEFTQEKQKLILDQNDENIFHAYVWEPLGEFKNYDGGMNSLTHWRQVFQHMSQTGFEILSIVAEYDQKLFLSICISVYGNLKSIHIASCRLLNLEFLSFFIAREGPMTLNMDRNEITQVKALNKLNWPRCKFINFFLNPIRHFQITRMNMSETCEGIWLQQNSIMCQGSVDMNLLAKLPIRTNKKSFIFRLSEQKNRKILQKNLMPILKRKLPLSKGQLYTKNQNKYQTLF